MSLQRHESAPAASSEGQANFTLAGTAMAADPSGAVLLTDERILVVADLHFEKGSAFAARGDAWLPPYDTGATLDRLERVCRHYQPRRVVCLGDSFSTLR